MTVTLRVKAHFVVVTFVLSGLRKRATVENDPITILVDILIQFDMFLRSKYF